MGFCRQEYWSGSPCPPPGDLPEAGSNPHLVCLLNWWACCLPLAPPGKIPPPDSNTGPQSWYSKTLPKNKTCNINNIWEIVTNTESLGHSSPAKSESLFNYKIPQWFICTLILGEMSCEEPCFSTIPLLTLWWILSCGGGCPVLCSLLICILGFNPLCPGTLPLMGKSNISPYIPKGLLETKPSLTETTGLVQEN